MSKSKGPTPRRSDPAAETAAMFSMAEPADQAKAIGAMLTRRAGGVSSWGINDLVPIPLPSGPYTEREG